MQVVEVYELQNSKEVLIWGGMMNEVPIPGDIFILNPVETSEFKEPRIMLIHQRAWPVWDGGLIAQNAPRCQAVEIDPRTGKPKRANNIIRPDLKIN